MTVTQMLAAAAASGLERLDAQLLLLHALGRNEGDRAWLLAHDDDEVAPAAARAFRALCERRVAGEPVAYLVGHKEFFGLDLKVDPRVLVPRPDTEVLVEWALELLPPGRPSRVIDLGTGSGAIALAIKHARPAAHVEATDASGDALEVARANALAHSLTVTLRRASWLDGASGPYDLVVSNPPYIAPGDHHLAALAHEPLSALAAGEEGLADLSQIIAQAPRCLARGGWLLLEHGFDQGAAVRALLSTAGLVEVATRRDLSGHERCSGGKWLELG
ncbi:peptide chain release factor N(5)-glutamine methyltransferase [Caenimonas koreensis]|uniref:Release factor glutamine methyltransferase n=1 Tax=Caenimonas koreensis DSM 17982 TaxID=1121255 RepID=A0A844B885_9BURK|nr:peptide chain release factor N(5)-glutamine methyltransferase [Caenimonas koreensis]MRD47656.1 peptide chain release factor N(5)-glutamine methyltransferase [Caenimonas koreensis DSM 17982]